MSDRLSVDAFAYEVLHGVHLTEVLLGAALESARRLRELYPDLERAAKAAEDAIANLYGVAGQVWHEEVKKAEAEGAPDTYEKAIAAAVDAVREGLTGGMYSKTDNALDAAARRILALTEPPCTRTD